MANEKVIKTRIQLKNDTEANWNKAVNFIPKQGEIIIYSADDSHPYSRLKVGNGETGVISLPFIDAGTINGEVLKDVIITGANRYSFPLVGQNNKLYVALDKNVIYCFTPNSGYTQLSHFKYTTTKTQISIINNWTPGIMTTVSVDDASLVINNGTAPTLNLGALNVVTDISEVN